MATSCGSNNVIAHRKDAENAEKVFSFLLSPANTNGIKGRKAKMVTLGCLLLEFVHNSHNAIPHNRHVEIQEEAQIKT